MENKKFIFHIHLPKGIEKIGQPIVLGDGKELGNWENPIVKLCRPFPGNSTYWQSEITIPSNFPKINIIKYKFAVHISKSALDENDEKEEEIIFEGNSPEDDRILDIERESQFAIWKNNFDLSQKLNIYLDNIQDYAFVDYIFKTIGAYNLNDKIMEYRHLLSFNEYLTIRSSNLEYIINNINDDLKEKRLFLCLLLGYHVSRQDLNYELPKSFPSELLLNALDNYKQETLPSNIKVPMQTAITNLVQHNAFQDQFHWLRIFTIATEVDPEYIFIYYLKDLKYPSDDVLEKFIEEMEIISPHIKNIEPEIYINLAKWLIGLCHNNDALIKLWCDILWHNDEIDTSISPSFIDRIKKNISDDDAVVLEIRFKRIPKDCLNDISEAFRDQTLSLLKNPFIKWTDPEISAVKKFLQNDNLNWHREEIIQSLEMISQSESLELLNIFPEMLDDWFRRDFSDTKEKKIPRLSNNWFTNLINRLNISNTNESRFVYLIFQQLENIYPLLSYRKNIWKNLTNIATDRVKECSESHILGSTKFMIQIREQEVKELFINIIKDIVTQPINDQFIDKIFMMCDCKSETLEVPNSMCENILCYIMFVSQSQAFTSSTSTSIESSKFWNVILNVTGSVEKLKENSYSNVRRRT